MGTNPLVVVRRQSSAGNDTVDMRMEQEILAPSVEDSEKANLGAEMFWVLCYLDEGFGNASEQQVV